jgi:hypothetical protein
MSEEKLKPGTLLRVKYLNEIPATYYALKEIKGFGMKVNLVSASHERAGIDAIGIRTYLYDERYEVFVDRTEQNRDVNISAGLEGLMFVEEKNIPSPVPSLPKHYSMGLTFYRVICDEKEYWVDKNDVVVM